MGDVRERLSAVWERIETACAQSGRPAGSVKLVAVTKGVPVAQIVAAVKAGVTAVGESRAQEAREKWPVLPTGVERHFVGHLQANKIKYVLSSMDLLHSLDRWSLAQDVARAAASRGATVKALLQVNIAGEATKGGLRPGELAEVVRRLAELPGLSIEGLMTMAPYSPDPAAARPVFAACRTLAAAIADLRLPKVSMAQLSMGMSGDYPAAVSEGATLVRIGAAIFGERQGG
ncbi:MAG: YggS family pyridoxal phosphate-dependent enzyme [Bacillota bacterium]